jgi:hypothetical protein
MRMTADAPDERIAVAATVGHIEATIEDRDYVTHSGLASIIFMYCLIASSGDIVVSSFCEIEISLVWCTSAAITCSLYRFYIRVS